MGFDRRDGWTYNHQVAFTLAKANEIDHLEIVRAMMNKAIANGITFAQFRKNLAPIRTSGPSEQLWKSWPELDLAPWCTVRLPEGTSLLRIANRTSAMGSYAKQLGRAVNVAVCLFPGWIGAQPIGEAPPKFVVSPFGKRPSDGRTLRSEAR